jgi:Skp family chaperone for outer membrane proteins
MMKTAAWILLPLLFASFPSTVKALEVSLEENRADRGSIGYVDLQRVFQRFPEVQKAKQSFQEIIRQAEDQVNLRKAEVFAVRAEVSKLEIELDLLKKTPIFVPEQTPAEAAALQASSATVSTAAVSGSTQTAPALSTASLQSLTLNLPGMTTGPVMIEPPSGKSASQAPPQASTQTAAAPPVAAAVSASTGPASMPAAAGLARAEDEQKAAEARRQTQARAQAAELATAAARARDTRLRELQASISSKRKDLADKEEAYKKYQAQVENNLLELEGRRTEILLGKIYTIIQEVAHENGVGVVIDKSQILFGQHTVDITDKVIKKMEGI